VLFDLYRLPHGQAILWPTFMLILLRRVIEAELVNVIDRSAFTVMTGGIRLNPDHLVLTDKGRQFLDELGVSKL
jgi:hypothetical protein